MVKITKKIIYFRGKHMIDKKSATQIIQEKKILGKMPTNINNKKIYNICYVFDFKAVRGAGVSMCSICENNKNSSIVFHAICIDLGNEDITRLKQIANKYQTTILLIKKHPF